MELILFGANELTELFIKRGQYRIKYVVDNDKSKQGECIFEGVPIKAPEVIKEEINTSFLVVVMVQNEKSIESVIKQLQMLGVDNRNYVTLEESNLDVDFLSWDVCYKRNIVEHCGKIMPRSLHLGLSDVCNLKCLFCGFHGKKTPWCEDGHYMTIPIATQIAKQAKNINTLDTLYITHDGEDLLNPKWCEIVQLILKETGIRKFRIYTNGMLLNDANISKLSSLEVDDVSLVISVDGETAEENNEIRVGSNYEIIKRNIYNARKQLDKNVFHMAINNNHIIKEEKLRKDNFVFSKFLQEIPQYLYEDFKDEDIMIVSTPTLYLAPEEMGFPDIPGYKYVKARKTHRNSGCFNPFETVSINAQGGILYCGCNVTQDEIGNVMIDDMLEVWQNNELLQEARKKIRFDRVTPQLCQNCPSKIDGEFYVVCK